jgi:predicted ATPase
VPEAVIAAVVGSAMPYFFSGIAAQLLAFRYVGPDRQIVRSVVPLGGIDNQNPQTAEEVVNTLAFGDEILARVSETLRTTFQYGVDKALFRGQALRPGDTGPQVGLVSTSPGARRRNIVNMGAGFTQFGWIALQLELARLPQVSPYYPNTPAPTPIVGVEEPELHLHPRQQLAVARLLAGFAIDGGQVLCTTQSEHFLLAILEMVLDGTLRHDHVAVHYLETGTVQPLEVDEKGRLKGGLRGFLETNEERVKRQIDLLRKSANLDS